MRQPSVKNRGRTEAALRGCCDCGSATGSAGESPRWQPGMWGHQWDWGRRGDWERGSWWQGKLLVAGACWWLLPHAVLQGSLQKPCGTHFTAAFLQDQGSWPSGALIWKRNKGGAGGQSTGQGGGRAHLCIVPAGAGTAPCLLRWPCWVCGSLRSPGAGQAEISSAEGEGLCSPLRFTSAIP